MSSFRLRHPALIFGSLGALAAVVVIAVALNSLGDSRPDYPFTVQTFDDQGREHLDPGETYDFYDSNPPTTGPHAPRRAEWGVLSEPIPKEIPVHNMEHGGVVIWYNCLAGDEPLDDEQCEQLRDQLTAITEEALAEEKPVLMLPYPDIDNRIVLSAWRTLDAFDEFNGERVQAFIDSYELRFNPERIRGLGE